MAHHPAAYVLASVLNLLNSAERQSLCCNPGRYEEYPTATTVGLRRAGLLPLKPDAQQLEFTVVDNTNGVDGTGAVAQLETRSQELQSRFGRSVSVSAWGRHAAGL